MTLGADDVQTAGGENLFLVLFDFFLEFVLYLFNLLRGFVAFQDLFQPHVNVAAQLNVGTAAGHVGGNGNGAGNAGLRDNCSLAFMMTGI